MCFHGGYRRYFVVTQTQCGRVANYLALNCDQINLDPKRKIDIEALIFCPLALHGHW